MVSIKTSLTCSISVKGRCIILIIVVTQLTVHISETKLDFRWDRVGKTAKDVFDVIL
jgi:hypothetical protein